MHCHCYRFKDFKVFCLKVCEVCLSGMGGPMQNCPFWRLLPGLRVNAGLLQNQAGSCVHLISAATSGRGVHVRYCRCHLWHLHNFDKGQSLSRLYLLTDKRTIEFEDRQSGLLQNQAGSCVHLISAAVDASQTKGQQVKTDLLTHRLHYEAELDKCRVIQMSNI